MTNETKTMFTNEFIEDQKSMFAEYERESALSQTDVMNYMAWETAKRKRWDCITSAVENYPAALEEIERLQAQVAELQAEAQYEWHPASERPMKSCRHYSVSVMVECEMSDGKIERCFWSDPVRDWAVNRYGVKVIRWRYYTPSSPYYQKGEPWLEEGGEG